MTEEEPQVTTAVKSITQAIDEAEKGPYAQLIVGKDQQLPDKDRAFLIALSVTLGVEFALENSNWPIASLLEAAKIDDIPVLIGQIPSRAQAMLVSKHPVFGRLAATFLGRRIAEDRGLQETLIPALEDIQEAGIDTFKDTEEQRLRQMILVLAQPKIGEGIEMLRKIIGVPKYPYATETQMAIEYLEEAFEEAPEKPQFF